MISRIQRRFQRRLECGSFVDGQISVQITRSLRDLPAQTRLQNTSDVTQPIVAALLDTTHIAEIRIA